MDLEYSWLKKQIRAITGIDLDSYRPEQMKRLMERAIEKSGARNYVQFIKDLENNPEKIQQLRDNLTINVSSLFRDIARWKEFESVARNYIIEKSGGSADDLHVRDSMTMRMWSAGCSIGAEPYTISIIAEEMLKDESLPSFSYHIHGTDIDNSMLTRAREGVFTDREAKEVPAGLLRRYFEEIDNPDLPWMASTTANRFYRAVPLIRSKMIFKNHNLLKDKWEKNYDLIVCRNVLIYFTNEIKEGLFRNFSDSLRSNGILFIGGTEVIFKPGDYGLKNEKAGIYRKVSE